ncbi:MULTISPECIES: alpha/beta fold hydrolase [Bacillus]|uniref:alpha/beta fold hydrolase n=1 Tax=Bacillus TaxID=1386 RepID=UPI000C76EAA1|nr:MULTISPECIES: alpha/beta fold hydrolase [Bacillus]MCP1160263.1 alpha/beta fold hydrolase [Bacillus infantis]PLR73937.1 hydroxyalkanoic acid synthase [Bacillus sp. UMB0728]
MGDNSSSSNGFWSEKEQERWRGFFRTLSAAQPDQGCTYRRAVWKKNKAVLWHYPPAERKYSTPMFLIYSLINQPYILDLAPNESMIEVLVNKGYDVYLIDFGAPGYEDKDLTITDYIRDYIAKAAARALRHSGASELTVMGFCLGGTIAAIYASISEEPIKNLVLFVTPIDFSILPAYDEWIEAVSTGRADFDAVIDALGIIPAPLMEAGMRLLTSPIYLSHYLSLLNRSYDEKYTEKWQRFNTWTSGHIPFSGAALKQIFHELGRRNSLMDGSLIIDGKKADLANIQANLLAVATAGDRLVPREQVEPVIGLVSSRDRTFHLQHGGHANLATGGQLPPYLTDWLHEHSEPSGS